MDDTQAAGRNAKEALFSVPQIERMVHEFYARVREDPELGPVFQSRIDDWPVHLERMVWFWRAILRAEPGFTVSTRGTPPVLHRQISELSHRHFDRWLWLFGQVADGIYSTIASEQVKLVAGRIARSLSSHLGPRAGAGAGTRPAAHP